MKRLFECSITFYCIHGVNLMREKFFLSSISWETIDWWTEATSSWNTGLWLVRSNNSIWTLIKVIIADYYWLPATYYRINLAPDQRIYLPIQISMIYLLSALHSSPHPWVCHYILSMVITCSLLSSVGSSFFSVFLGYSSDFQLSSPLELELKDELESWSSDVMYCVAQRTLQSFSNHKTWILIFLCH